jgi:hypothetical protein
LCIVTPTRSSIVVLPKRRRHFLVANAKTSDNDSHCATIAKITKRRLRPPKGQVLAGS